MTKEKWIWMPHAGHLIVGNDCRFHLNTFVGKYIVSTVGEYWPDSRVREITAKVRDIEIQGIGDCFDRNYMGKIGFEEIGLGRQYETMVFRAIRQKGKEAQCCPWLQSSGSDVDFAGYNDPVSAFKGHLRLCTKWSKKCPTRL